MDDSLLSKFHPIVLLNCNPADTFDELINYLNSKSYTIRFQSAIETKYVNISLRFMSTIAYLDGQNLNNLTPKLQNHWRSSALHANESTFVSLARQEIVPKVLNDILDFPFNNNLTTFNQPALVVHLDSDESSHGPLEDLKSQVMDWIEVTSPQFQSFDQWIPFINDVFSDKLAPLIISCINEALNRLNTSSQGALGIANRFMSLGKKYLVNQNPLLGLKHSEETVYTQLDLASSSTSLNKETLQLRRAADYSLILGNYRQAANIYDYLRKEAQNSKNWIVASSHQQWQTIAKLLLGSVDSFPTSELYGIVQQFMMFPETQIVAIHLVAILSRIPSVSDDVLFGVCLRISQSETLNDALKIPLLIMQTYIALSLRDPKRRLASLFLERFGACCEGQNLNHLALLAYQTSLKLVSQPEYFESLTASILRLSKCLDVSPPNITMLPGTSLEHMEYIWKAYPDTNFDPKSLKIVSFSVAGHDYFSPYLHCADMDWVLDFTNSFWLWRNVKLDPVKLLETNLEHFLSVNSSIMAELTLKNEFGFTINLSEIKLLDSNNSCLASSSDGVTIKSNQSQKICFDVNFDSFGSFRISSISFRVNQMVKGSLMIDQKWFRLNTRRPEYFTPTYSDNRSNVFNIDDGQNKLDYDLVFKDSHLFFWQDSNLVLKIFSAGKSRNLNIVIISDVIQPENYEIKLENGLKILKNLFLEPGKDLDISFKLSVPPEECASLRLAIIDEAYSFPKLISRSLAARPLLSIESIMVRGLELPTPKIVTIQIKNLVEHSCFSNIEAIMIIDEAHYECSNPESLIVNPGSSCCVSFRIPRNTKSTGILSINLKNEALHLMIPIKVEVSRFPDITFDPVSSVTNESLKSFKARVNGCPFFMTQDHLSSQSFYVGDIKRQLDPGEMSELDVSMISSHGEYICLPSPVDNSSNLMIYGSGRKVMVFDDQFQLVQLIRTLARSHIVAVAYDNRTGTIAAAYEDRVEIFEAISHDEQQYWKRSAAFNTEFQIGSLAWSGKGLLAVAGESVSVYRSAGLRESRSLSATSLESGSRLGMSTWVPVFTEKLAEGTLIDDAQFSPDGRLLATLQKNGKSPLLWVWCCLDFIEEPDRMFDDLTNLLGRANAQAIDSAIGNHKVAFVEFLLHESPVVGFCWSPMTQYKQAYVLLTWTSDNIYHVWIPERIDHNIFDFHLVHSFESNIAWFEAGFPIRISFFNEGPQRIQLANVESHQDRLIKVLPLDEKSDLKLKEYENISLFAPSINILVATYLNSSLIEVFEYGPDKETAPLFTWSRAEEQHFPIQSVSPYNMLAASVYLGTASTLDVCRLGAGCSIEDYLKVELDEGEEIETLLWISSGQALLSTSRGSYALEFIEEPLELRKKIKIHNNSGTVLVGMIPSSNLYFYWSKSKKLFQQYQIGTEDESVKHTVSWENMSYDYVQFLESLDTPYFVGAEANLREWSIFTFDKGNWFKCKTLENFTDRVRYAKTSMFADIAVITPKGNHSDQLKIVSLHSKSFDCGEFDSILAMKWVVIDIDEYIRHLVVCTISGVLVVVSSLNEKFEEIWHIIDLTPFPFSLSPPLSLGQASISSNNLLDIWISIDDFIVMFAPSCPESPVWDTILNAMIPDGSLKETSLKYTHLFSFILDASLKPGQTASPSMKLSRASTPKPTNTPKDSSYEFLFLEPSKPGDIFDDSASENDDKETNYHTDSNSEFGNAILTNQAMDQLAQKFIMLTSHSEINSHGLNFIYAYLSDAQEVLIKDCLKDQQLTWKTFVHFGFSFWVRSREKLLEIVDSMFRFEFNRSGNLEEISIFQILCGKRRALQLLWKSNQQEKISSFLGRDFKEEIHRVAASKNAFASLGKQKYRLAIMFFILADQYSDALKVALDTLKDYSLAMLIARLADHEESLYQLVQPRTDFPACLVGILESLLGRTEDLISTCFTKARETGFNDAEFPILAALANAKLPTRHWLTFEELEGSVKYLLRLGAYEPALKLFDQANDQADPRTTLLRSFVNMSLKRWNNYMLRP